MASPRLRTWGFFSAIGASAAWALLSGDSIARPDPESYRDVLFLLPWTLTAVAVTCLHFVQRDRAGRLGRAGYRITLGAMILGGCAVIALALGVESAMAMAFPVLVLAWIAGMAVLGIATMRAGVVARWAGLALLLSEPATILTGLALSPWVPLSDDGSYSGALANAVAMLLLGIALRKTARGRFDVELRGNQRRAPQPAETGVPPVFS